MSQADLVFFRVAASKSEKNQMSTLEKSGHGGTLKKPGCTLEKSG